MLERVREAHRLREASEANLVRLKAQQTELQAAVASLRSPRGVEAEIRRRFGVAKPGEGVIEIIEIPSTAGETLIPKTFWRRVIDWF